MTRVTDITHFLNESNKVAELPEPAMKLVQFLGKIVEAVSVELDSPIVAPELKCCERSTEINCEGDIEAWALQNGTIEWHCDRCDENGTISNWEASPWDASKKIYH